MTSITRSICRKPILYALSFVLLCLSLQNASASEIVINDFRKGLSPRWKEKIFSGRTRYKAGLEEGRWSIRAESRSSASALYYEIKYDPKDYPILGWRWKVTNILSRGDARKKEGDDYAARLYVVFDAFMFWNTRTLNYIWANRLPIGEALPNAFTRNAMLIAVESGSAHTGQWREVRRNIFEDYLRYFHETPPKVTAIAIMTDTDNTGQEAGAWYGPIRALSE